jgi:hypothetical protein
VVTGDGGRFGAWSRDEAGLPRFDLRGEALREDVWHQLGNDSITASAHADGAIDLYAWEAGLVRLTERVPFASPAELQVRWGFGYAEWRRYTDGLSVTRRAWAPFGDVPALRIDVKFEGRLPECHVETWRFSPYPLLLGGLMSRWTPAASTASLRQRLVWNAMLAASTASRAATEAVRRLLGWRLRLRPRFDPALRAVLLEPAAAPPEAERSSWLPRLRDVVFVASLGSDALKARTPRAGRRSEVELKRALPRGAAQAQLAFAVGISSPEELPAVLATLRAASPAASAAAWHGVWDLDLPAQPDLARESQWHALYLRSAQVRDRVLGCRYLPQGSAYSYLHGLQGAVRDYALSSLPLTLIDPKGAGELLRLCLRLVDPDGAVHYGHTGAGRMTAGGLHSAPSDLPLFLLWAVSDYVRATRDAALAADASPALLRTWRWLRDALGRGPHGLLRAGSGDWNDPLTAFAPSRRAFRLRGESCFNSAMAAYVLPRAAELLPAEAASMRELAASLGDATAATWTGSWFLRGFDGRGAPIGRDHLFLDANAWCLIARIGSDAQRRALVDAVVTRCGDPSPIGPTILDRPHRVRAGILQPGWDVNGGVWAAIGALAVWGIALHDPERAWQSLLKQTLAAHARAYPDVWYGIWSGPDAYNSHHGDRPGETYVQPATPMREFPVMNSNAHAGPLLGLLKVLGLESTPAGLRVEARAPAATRTFQLRCSLGTWSGD